MVKKWLNNLISITSTGKAGICPFCKSEDTDFTFVGQTGKAGFGVIWCNNCKRGFNISRAIISDKYPLNKPIPKDLIL